MKPPVALQIYSVRQDAQKDLISVLDQVADMGYDGVEFAGFYGNDLGEVKAALDRLGLKAEGTHTPIGDFADDKIAATIEAHKILDCRFAIIPWMPEEMRNSEAACLETAAKLTDITHRLAASGLRTGFHAHEGDMRPLPNGKSAWDMLAANTPSEFIMQYDTANGMSGGADPVKPILDWPGRSVSVHLKGPGKELVGESGIDWPKVFEACESVGGTQWYVVEFEEESDMSPLDAVRQCRVNLKSLGR